jgi:hypothetical protein
MDGVYRRTFFFFNSLLISFLFLLCVVDSTGFAFRFSSDGIGSLLLHQLLFTPKDLLPLSFDVLPANIQFAFKLLHASPGGMILRIQMSDLFLEEGHGYLQTG